jgi:membrane-associated phospholipid phosphatase
LAEQMRLSPVRSPRPPCCTFLTLLLFTLSAFAADDKAPPTNAPSPAAIGQADASDPSALRTLKPPQPSLRDLPLEVFHDQVFLWLRPFQPRRADLPWAAAFFGTTAGLIAIDRHVGQGLSANPPGTGYQFGKTASTLGTPLTGGAIAGTFYLVGRARKDPYAQATGILGIRAIIDSVIIVQALKAATQRPRPTFSGGTTRDHNADGQFFSGGNSFPSGHTIGAFSLATVIAERYREHPWVPVTAYSLAGLVGIARIAERQHFPSDVFVGAALGYLIGRHVAHSAEAKPASAWNRLHIEPLVPAYGGSALSVSWDF